MHKLAEENGSYFWQISGGRGVACLIQEGIGHGLGIVLHKAVNLVHVLCALPQGSPGPCLQHWIVRTTLNAA